MELKAGERYFFIGDRVKKGKGDYTFEGWVVCGFEKKSKASRYVVEDDRGLLFIFSPHQLELVDV